MGKHVLYDSSDFLRDEESRFQEPSHLETLVLDGGLAVCKVCKMAEIELENCPECPGVKDE